MYFEVETDLKSSRFWYRQCWESFQNSFEMNEGRIIIPSGNQPYQDVRLSFDGNVVSGMKESFSFVGWEVVKVDG